MVARQNRSMAPLTSVPSPTPETIKFNIAMATNMAMS
jgi:hypothetical protein